MVRLELSDDVANELEALLERLSHEMEREIAGTDSREFRQDLKKREGIVKDVLDKLKRPLP
jgi:hypothetical protein